MARTSAGVLPDPELTLAEGSFYPKDSNFRHFLWTVARGPLGQILMKRRELVEAKQGVAEPSVS